MSEILKIDEGEICLMRMNGDETLSPILLRKSDAAILRLFIARFSDDSPLTVVKSVRYEVKP